MIYKIESRQFGATPLQKLHDWARRHDASQALIDILAAELFKLESPHVSLEIACRMAEEDSRLYLRDAITVRDLQVGDVVMNRSFVDTHSGYRKDLVLVYRWNPDLNCWEKSDPVVQYYAKTFPFGRFEKPMPDDWGFRRSPPIWLP